MINKVDVLLSILSVLEKQREEAEQSMKSAHAAMVDAPGPMQSHSDTTRFQKSILVDSASSIIAEKVRAINIINVLLDSVIVKRMESVQAGAVVELSGTESRARFHVVVPFAGGIEVSVDGESFITISPSSPLGAAILGKREGEEVYLEISSSRRRVAILSLF